MVRKRSKNRGNKPKNLKSATLADNAVPMRQSGHDFPVVAIEANPITEAVQLVVAERIASALFDSDPTPIPSSSAATIPPPDVTGSPSAHSLGVGDVEVEVLSEVVGEEADAFLAAMAAEEVVEDFFAVLQGPPARPIDPIGSFEVDLSALDRHDDRPTIELPPPPTAKPQKSPSIHAAKTISPPPPAKIIAPASDSPSAHTDLEHEQTGDYTETSEMLWQFLNSPAADRYHRAQAKFEETKDIADKPDLDALVRDFHIRKGGLKI